MRRPLISDHWAREYHCKNSSGFRNGIMITPLTFCGVLEDLYPTIARNWSDSTRKKYDRDYNNVILPNIENHNCRIISSYTKEDCDKVLSRIQEDGYARRGTRVDYSESAISHFRFLIYVVFIYAYTAGYCRDFLWGTKYEIYDDREALAVRSKTVIKKSLTIEQEKKLIHVLLGSPDESGRLIALLLMFVLGLRDGEACGLDYGDIYELPYYKNHYVAVIKQSTIPDTNRLQSSGKTWNTGRRIPIPGFIVGFLQVRKAMIEDIINKNDLKVDINRLPVASACDLCQEYPDVGKRLKADDVTEEARRVFRQAGIESEVLASLEIEMEEECSRLEISESNVTAYLLRRNFATQLKILGLDNSDIQYLLGHCIEDPYILRPDYTDGKLYQLSKRMAYRPLVNYKPENCIKLLGDCEKQLSGSKSIEIDSHEDCIEVFIFALEKNDSLLITINPEGTDYTVHKEYKSFELRRTIDILQKYTDDYMN